MNRNPRILAIAILLLFIPLRQFAQQRQIKVSEFSVTHIRTIEERVFMLHSILEKGYYCYKNENKPNTIDVYVPSDAPDELSDFDFFLDNMLFDQLDEFSYLDKTQRGELFVQWRQGIDDEVFKVLYEDFTRGLRTDNATCETAFPFCTDNGLYTFPAGVDSGSPCGDYYNSSCSAPYACSGTPGQSSNCLSTAPNPAFYYMMIDEPGDLTIYMYSTPQVDIDFDCWGPFDDIGTACDQLACSNIVDCSYRPDPTENCHITNAQTGQFYILLITNYSNDPCNINFSKTAGDGTTDCSILPPLVNNDGPYCVGETIHLRANGQPGSTYNWTGPNNFSSILQNPIIENCTMNHAGEYTCTITVGNESNSATTEIIIYPQPIADFEFTTVCEGYATEFTSTSTTNPAGQQISVFEWDFGDGQTSTGATVNHTYAQAGTFEATLTVKTGEDSCTDQITQTVTVYAPPTITVTAQPTIVIYGGTASLTATPDAPGTYNYHWEPANMVTNPNSQTTQTVPLEASQTYTVTVTDAEGGCVSTAQIVVSMEGSNLTATASAEHPEICEGGETTLHALPAGGTGNYVFSWTPTNTLNNPNIQNPTATPPLGTTTYTCHISDGIAEQDASVTIMVHPNEETELYAAICENETYSFFGQSLSVAGVYTHTLQTQHGCDSVLRLNLSTNGLDESEFTVSSEENCDSYFWDPMGHEIINTDHEGNTYDMSGSYHRTYLNHLGCDSLVTMNVQFEYTPSPTEIYPMDPDNIAPHWVITATEFQIIAYDFHLWDTNPYCHWDTVTWDFEDPEIEWVLEPFGEHGKCCKLYVLNQVEDTVWMRAHAFNRCAPQEGVEQRYWFVCSFYGIEEDGSSTSPGTFDFSVAPNPNNGQMALRFEHLAGKVGIKVYDMRGMLIDDFETFNSIGDCTLTYNMSDHAEGIYFFVATAKEGTIAKKVVIRH